MWNNHIILFFTSLSLFLFCLYSLFVLSIYSCIRNSRSFNLKRSYSFQSFLNLFYIDFKQVKLRSFVLLVDGIKVTRKFIKFGRKFAFYDLNAFWCPVEMGEKPLLLFFERLKFVILNFQPEYLNSRQFIQNLLFFCYSLRSLQLFLCSSSSFPSFSN